MKRAAIAALTGLIFWAAAGDCPADRLYTWTDEQGVTHITEHPPPAKGKLQDVLDYSQRTHQDIQASKKLQQESQPGQTAEETLDAIEADNRRTAEEVGSMNRPDASTDNSCYLQAPDYGVQVRIYSVNAYNERDAVIWNGIIEAGTKKLITGPDEVLLYNFRKAPKGVFGGDNRINCSGGVVIQMIQ